MDNSTYLSINVFILVFSLVISSYYKNKAKVTFYNIKRNNLKQSKLWLYASAMYFIVISLKIVEITIKG